MSKWMTGGSYRLKNNRRSKHGAIKSSGVDTRPPFGAFGGYKESGVSQFGGGAKMTTVEQAPRRVNPFSNPFEEYKYGSPPVSRVQTRIIQTGMGSPSGSSDIFALNRGRGGGGGGGWAKRR